MEIDARTIREVEFREKIRGYNPDDVDDFLEQVAVAFEVMEDRLKAAGTAAEGQTGVLPEAKDQRTSIVSAPIDRSKSTRSSFEFDDDIIQRTLLLAQKTADTAVREAEELAATMVQEAKVKAEALMTQANQRAREIVEEASNRARDEVLELAKSKDRLLGELGQLNSKVSVARGQMKQLLQNMLEQIDETLAPFISKTDGQPSSGARPGSSASTEVLPPRSKESLFGDAPGENGSFSGVFDDESE